jgi:hypothetical protein
MDAALWLLQNQGELAAKGLTCDIDGKPIFTQLSMVDVDLKQVPESLHKLLNSTTPILVEKDIRLPPFCTRSGLKFKGSLKLTGSAVHAWKQACKDHPEKYPKLIRSNRIDIDTYLLLQESNFDSNSQIIETDSIPRQQKSRKNVEARRLLGEIDVDIPQKTGK